ncbi:MAG: right-handed parallel beta-helix repeat-containing protein [Kiritimatiellia bacterium]|nr:right-handed parallel beta-helix repeat-containing protein [Kiritimatiellia bacterium]
MASRIVSGFGLVAALVPWLHAAATEWHVDNVKGSDAAGDGSRAKPFQTIAAAVKRATVSDAICLTPNAAPYSERVNLLVGGTAEKPFVFDGRGAVINLLTRYGADKWKGEGGGVYSMPLPNNAHVMDGHWSGFDLVFFDGQAGSNCVSRETLVPSGYFLFKQRMKIGDAFHPLHNTLYIKLPEGRTPGEVKVEAPGVGTIFHCEKPHVVIRNLTAMRCTQDGFATTRAPGIVFERVRGCYNMDQGISHHGSEVTVRDSRFDHNAGCGIVDVYDAVKVRYERCLIEDDTYRGGVEFHSGEFVMEDCVIRNNPRKAVEVTRPNVRVTLRNCLLVGTEGSQAAGVYHGNGTLRMERCTIFGFRTGIAVSPLAGTLIVEGCAFIRCGTHYALPKSAAGAPLPSVMSDHNAFDAATFVLHGIPYASAQWDAMRARTGLDTHSIRLPQSAPAPPYSLPALRGRGRAGAGIGALIDPSRAYGPHVS